MIAKKRLLEGIFPEMTKKVKQEEIKKAFDELYDGTGAGSEMTGWLYWPREFYVSPEYSRLKDVSANVRRKNDAIVVIGIGGSYLTPQMLINSEYGPFYNELNSPKVYFAGCDLSPVKLKMILDLVVSKDYTVIYISKSGGTIEPAITFRVFWKNLVEKYGNQAFKHVIAITDPKDGTLKNLSNRYGWETFEIPKNIGGRYSGLTACGLLPSAIAGLNTDEILKGSIRAIREEENIAGFAAKYACWRFSNYSEGRLVEFIANNDPYMAYFSEWAKQLFGESEGKDQKGIFPASGCFPTDLHSLGQFLQDGSRNLIFETFFERSFKNDLVIPKSDLMDNLGAREGKSFTQAAKAAMDGAIKAHASGGNPCAIVSLESDLETIGYLMQSLFISCALYCYLLKVNPFDQPGVEQHKSIMKVSPEWNSK